VEKRVSFLQFARDRILTRRAFLAGLSGTFLAACGAVSGYSSVAPVALWGGQGLRDGSFLRPRAITCRDGRVYVIDTTGRVQVFDESGAFLNEWTTPEWDNGTPTAIGVGIDGTLLVPDTHYHRILEYTPEGNLLTMWGEYGSGPEQFIYPTGIVQAPDGRYFISEYGEDAERVHVFDSARHFAAQWGGHGAEPGQFNRAMAVALVGQTLYVADTTNHRICFFTLDGHLLGTAGSPGSEPGQLKFPFDITAAPDGSLITVEYGNNRLSRFSGDGRWLGCYGAAGREPGLFNSPRGVAVSESGDIFVADTYNHRIQRFTPEILA
jgi:DNA-binding beta-propeller fold protein YncE